MLTASSVELFYWPTPYAAPSPATTITPGPSLVTSVGPDGYTYTSPSVYVVYYSLSAWNFMNGAQAGSSYDALTLAYDPTELSTLYGCSQTALSTSALNFQDFNMPPRWSVLSQHQRCDTCDQVYQFPGPPHPGDELVSNYANMTYAYNAMVNGVTSWRLQPDFVIPPSLNDQDPHWHGCNGFTWGVFDPPRTLVAAPAMVAPATASSPSTTPDPKSPNTGDPAKPAPLPADPSPAQTPAPIPNKQSPPPDTQANSPLIPALNPSSLDPASDKQSPPIDPKLDNSAPPDLDLSHDPGAQSSPSDPKPNSPVNPASDQSQDKAAGQQSSSSDPKPENPSKPAADSSTGPAVNREDPSPDTEPNAPVAPQPSESTSPSVVVYGVAVAQVAAAGHTLAAHPNGGIVIDGHHLSSGSSDTTTNGIRIAHNSAGMIIGGNAIQIPSALVTSPFASLNGQGVAKASGGGIIVGGSTISSGTKTSIGNVQVSVADSSVSVIPTTLPYVAINPAGSSPSTRAPSGKLDQNSKAASVGDNEGKVASGPSAPALGIVAAGETWTPLNHGTLVANGATVSVGGAALKTSGTVLSMNNAGLIAHGSTIVLPSTAPQTTPAPAGIFTIAGQTFTPLDGNNDRVLMNGNTALDAGATAITINGIAISLGSSALVVGTSTIPLLTQTPTPTLTPAPIMTAAGQTFTPIGSNTVVVHDDGSEGSNTTLSMGGAALTSHGTVISMASGGLVIGGLTTIPISPPPSSSGISTSAGLGGAIMAGFGPRGGNSSAPEVFEGGAAAVGRSFWEGMGMRLVVVGGVCLVFGSGWVMEFLGWGS